MHRTLPHYHLNFSTRHPNMKIKLAIIFLSLALTYSISYSYDILSLSTGIITSNNDIPTPVKVVTSTEEQIEVSYEINELAVSQQSDSLDSFIFELNNFGINTTLGEYAYLINSDKVIIPNGKEAILNITECEYVEFPYILSLAQLPYPDGQGVNNVDPYKDEFPNHYSPHSFVSLGEINKYRGIIYQYINVTPILYDESKKVVKIFTKLKFTVNFVSSSHNVAKSSEPAILNDPFLDYVFINSTSEGYITSEINTELLTPKDYLIITTPKFEKEVNRFARWKKIIGFNTIINSKDEWTADTVKECIQEYALSHPNFYYLLIVGDNEDVPYASTGPTLWNTQDNPSTYISDYDYSCLDGDDQSDIYIGRIPVSTPTEARTIFDKIISYEKNPPAEENFYKNGLHASYFQVTASNPERECRCFIQTSEKIRDMMMEYGKNISRVYYAENKANPKFKYDGSLLPVELNKPKCSWIGNSDEISSIINSGVFYVFHRDHGSPYSWGNPHYDINNIDNLNNSKLPLVFSINCETGKFDLPECFAEKFLRKRLGGCLAIFAASALSPSTTNDILSEKIFKVLMNNNAADKPEYRGSTLSLGEILNIGLSNLITDYGYNATTKYERKIYNCFGDPSMLFLTEKPYCASDVEIRHIENEIYISSKNLATKIIVYDECEDNVMIYKACEVIVDTSNDHNYTINISSEGMRPIIYENTNDRILKIQNDIIENNRTFTVDKIIIGDSISDSYPYGEVNINSGNIKLRGEVSIEKNVKIQ